MNLSFLSLRNTPKNCKYTLTVYIPSLLWQDFFQAIVNCDFQVKHRFWGRHCVVRSHWPILTLINELMYIFTVDSNYKLNKYELQQCHGVQHISFCFLPFQWVTITIVVLFNFLWKWPLCFNYTCTFAHSCICFSVPFDL